MIKNSGFLTPAWRFIRPISMRIDNGYERALTVINTLRPA